MCNKSYAKYRLYARSLKKEGERWYFIVEKKGNCTRGFPRIFLRIHVWGREYLRSWRSPSLPHSEIKSYTIPDISRIGFATLSLKANDYHSAYLWNSGESVHARVYTCSKFVPFETNAKEKWYEKWSNYATYCKDPYSSPPCAPTPLEKLSLHRREELFRLWNNWLFFSFFFVFFPRMKMTIYRVDISVITRWLHAKLLLRLAFNGRERKNCNNSESLSETDGSEN